MTNLDVVHHKTVDSGSKGHKGDVMANVIVASIVHCTY